MTVAKREHKNERIKREKDPLDVLEDLERYAREGFGAISEDDLNVRLRWYGLYTQRPQEDGFFMLRVKVTNGTLDARQIETLLAAVARADGRGTAAIPATSPRGRESSFTTSGLKTRRRFFAN